MHDADLPPRNLMIEKITVNLVHDYFYSFEYIPQDWEAHVSNRTSGGSTLTLEDTRSMRPVSATFFQDFDIQVCRHFGVDDQIEVNAAIVVVNAAGERKTLPYSFMSFSFMEKQARRKLHVPSSTR